MNKDPFSVSLVTGSGCRSSPFRLRGLTLIELMVAIAIVAIMASIGVPSFREFMLEQQAESQRDAMMNSLATARVSAKRFSAPVYVCPSSDGSSCGSDWNTGWLVYLDSDRDAVLSTGDEVLSSHQYKGKIEILTSATELRFLPNGINTVANLNICSNENSQLNRAISVNPIGAIELQGSANADCTL